MADVEPTVVGAGSRVLGAGFTDDVLVDLTPFGLVVTPKRQQQQQVSGLFKQEKAVWRRVRAQMAAVRRRRRRRRRRPADVPDVPDCSSS